MLADGRIYRGVWRHRGLKVEEGGGGDFELLSSSPRNSSVSEASQRQTLARYHGAHSWGWETDVVLTEL